MIMHHEWKPKCWEFEDMEQEKPAHEPTGEDSKNSTVDGVEGWGSHL